MVRKSELFDAYLSETLTAEQTEELKKVLSTESGSKEFMHYMTESHLMCEILEKKSAQSENTAEVTKKKSPLIPFIISTAVAASIALFMLLKTPVESPSKVTIIEKGVKKEILLSERKIYKTAEINDLTLPDGSTVQSRGTGFLTVENPDKVSVENGLFSFAVKPTKGQAPFRIELSNGTIEVIGTAFDIIDSQEISSIRVTEGTVKFSFKGQELILTAGDSAAATKTSLAKTETNTAEKLELLIDGEYTDDKKAFRDISGKNRTGWASWTPGDEGSVKQVLEENNHAIEFTKSGRLGITNFKLNGALTLSSWLKPNGQKKHFQNIISNGGSSWRLTLFEETFRAHFAISGMTPEFINSEQSLTPNQWSLVTGVYDGNKFKMYINGVLDSEVTVSGSVGQYSSNVEVAGNHQQVNRNFEGALDGVQVYSRALSDLEILKLYQAGRP